MRAAIYARVSTLDQEPENQLQELRRYVHARSWAEPVEYVDHGVSGARDRRPALDRLVADATRRRFDVLICWRLDRLGRSLKHLITLLEDLQALGVAFVSLGEGIDCTTPAGTLQLHILAALAQFERARIAERVQAGLARARRQGKRLGRPPTRISATDLQRTAEYSGREAARAIGESPGSTLFRYVLPNAMAPILVQITLNFPSAITAEASLSFLGLGLVPPTISWGQMLSAAQPYLEVAPWLAVFPGLALTALIMGFVLLGDALRDHLDPRYHGRRRTRKKSSG